VSVRHKPVFSEAQKHGDRGTDPSQLLRLRDQQYVGLPLLSSLRENARILQRIFEMFSRKAYYPYLKALNTITD